MEHQEVKPAEEMLLLPEQVNLHLPEPFETGCFKNNLQVQTVWPEGERKEKKTQLEASSFHCLRSLAGSGNKDRIRSNHVKEWKIHPSKCSSAEKMD